MKYRKKPVVIDAIQLKAPGNEKEVIAFCEGEAKLNKYFQLEIETLEGTMTAFPGDWIIKGIQGEFYPCKPDIFQATYELVEPSHE